MLDPGACGGEQAEEGELREEGEVLQEEGEVGLPEAMAEEALPMEAAEEEAGEEVMEALPPAKRRKGRPPLSEEEKALRAHIRAIQKAEQQAARHAQAALNPKKGRKKRGPNVAAARRAAAANAAAASAAAEVRASFLPCSLFLLGDGRFANAFGTSGGLFGLGVPGLLMLLGCQVYCSFGGPRFTVLLGIRLCKLSMFCRGHECGQGQPI